MDSFLTSFNFIPGRRLVTSFSQMWHLFESGAQSGPVLIQLNGKLVTEKLAW